jgi:CMP-N,N'-diacetyllegionaminic acid synthase
MKILALITARGGSKRIPGKNIRQLGGLPLIVWSIESVKGLPKICEILVSTDDVAIADIARNAGALVPWLRPADLATDTASLEDVCLHALDWYEDKHGKVDGLLLLQPTSPFRSRATVQQGIETFEKHKRRLVLGVSPAKSHPMWCLSLERETLRPFMSEEGLHLRSQDLPPAYVMNGGFYLMAPDEFRQLRCFYSDDVVPLVIDDPEESMDIDTEWDWMIAESVLHRRSRRQVGS